MDDLKLYAKSEQQLDSLVQTIRSFSKDIGMQFGIDKCALIMLKRGKRKVLRRNKASRSSCYLPIGRRWKLQIYRALGGRSNNAQRDER